MEISSFVVVVVVGLLAVSAVCVERHNRRLDAKMHIGDWVADMASRGGSTRRFLMPLVVLQQGFCPRCKERLPGHPEEVHVDHIFPRSMGGGDDFENLQALCKTCNLSKGAKIE